MHSTLQELASLLAERNGVDARIAALIHRPASPGHIGEFIAASVFDIDLYASATHKGSDGTFRSGSLDGKSVNIKLYGKQEGILDIREDALPDLFLVLTGPKSPPISSRGGIRPLTIDHVYLFEARAIVASIKSRGAKVGIASSVPQGEWSAAEIWPEPRNSMLQLGMSQTESLGLFRSGPGA